MTVLFLYLNKKFFLSIGSTLAMPDVMGIASGAKLLFDATPTPAARAFQAAANVVANATASAIGLGGAYQQAHDGWYGTPRRSLGYAGRAAAGNRTTYGGAPSSVRHLRRSAGLHPRQRMMRLQKGRRSTYGMFPTFHSSQLHLRKGRSLRYQKRRGSALHQRFLRYNRKLPYRMR